LIRQTLFSSLGSGIFVSPKSAEILRRISDQIVAVDHAGMVTYANEPAALFVGTKPADLIGGSYLELFPAKGTKFEDKFRLAVEGQVPAVYETSEANGSRRFEVSLYPSRDGVTIWRKDITSRRSSEAASKERADRLWKVLNLMNEAFGLCEVVADASGSPADYRFLEVNQAFTVLTGLSQEAASGRTLTELLPHLKDQWLDCFRRASVTGDPVRFQSQDPAAGRWYEVFAYSVGPGHLAHLFIDVSETKKKETALQQHEQTLRELNENLERRVAERTDLAERRAFELRQLVEELGHTEQRTRMNLAQTLHDRLQQLLVAAKFRVRGLPYTSASELVEKTRQLEGLINEAIDEARSLALDLSPPVLQERGLAAGLKWLCRRLEEEHGLKIRLRTEAGSEPATEDMKLFLFQAARELLLNVVNHSGVSEAELTLERGIPGYLFLTVKDQGTGFDASKVIVRSPTGFGLFNIQQRLELLGGSVTIYSTAGGGCEVRLSAPVTLRAAIPPRILQPSEQRGSREQQPANSAGQPIRVMIVDDHEILREGLANLLESNSQIEVVGAAGDGAVAVEEARKLRPDVILMDITMPTMNGIEATRSIKSEMPDCRIIALSMHEREDMEQAMREAGAIAYVSKDVPWDELNSVIQRIVTG